jgi:hypothetical protein
LSARYIRRLLEILLGIFLNIVWVPFKVCSGTTGVCLFCLIISHTDAYRALGDPVRLTVTVGVTPVAFANLSAAS